MPVIRGLILATYGATREQELEELSGVKSEQGDPIEI